MPSVLAHICVTTRKGHGNGQEIYYPGINIPR